MRLFSTEQVSKYHPDKYADQISDAILTDYIRQDNTAKVACEVLVKDNTVVIAGEITANAHVNIEDSAQRVADKLGYKIDNIINLVGKQSEQIARHVTSDENIGAGDQGIMVGYATRETKSRLPYAFELANKIIKIIEDDVDHNPMTLLKGDAKTQITVDLDAKPDINSVKKILISVCHKDQIGSSPITLEHLRQYMQTLLMQSQIHLPLQHIELIVNPGGLWTYGGPKADCGLTGRKIVCDQYGGFTAVGGGAFSGKDPTKVDRSASYMARKLAVEMLESFKNINWIEIQLAYMIGESRPMSVNIKTDKPAMNNMILRAINHDRLKPKHIIEELGLLKGIDYERLAEGCHYYGHHW